MDKLPPDAAKPPGGALQGLTDKLPVPPDAVVPGLDASPSIDALAQALGKLPKP